MKVAPINDIEELAKSFGWDDDRQLPPLEFLEHEVRLLRRQYMSKDGVVANRAAAHDINTACRGIINFYESLKVLA